MPVRRTNVVKINSFQKNIGFHRTDWPVQILGLLYKRALFDLQFVHNLFWLKLKWNAISKLFYCIIYHSSMLWWSSRTLTKLKLQSQKCFNERKYKYLKYKNKNRTGHINIIGYQFGPKFKVVFCAKYERTWFMLLGNNLWNGQILQAFSWLRQMVEKIH
jgi:hypothetical protein